MRRAPGDESTSRIPPWRDWSLATALVAGLVELTVQTRGSLLAGVVALWFAVGAVIALSARRASWAYSLSTGRLFGVLRMSTGALSLVVVGSLACVALALAKHLR